MKSKKKMTEEMTKYLEHKFKGLSNDEKKALYTRLKVWAEHILLGEEQSIFLDALASVECLQATLLEIQLDNALARIRGEK